MPKIQKILKSKAKEKVKTSWIKFVASPKKVYGVKVPILNEIAKNIKNPDFNLVKKLWKSGAFEERLLATKILDRICKKDADMTLQLVKKFALEISDWATCDTLATQGVRKIAIIKQKEIFEFSQKLVSKKNFWQRRLGLVLLINFIKDKKFKPLIKGILKKVRDDEEYYVKKAVEWLERKLK